MQFSQYIILFIIVVSVFLLMRFLRKRQQPSVLLQNTKKEPLMEFSLFSEDKDNENEFKLANLTPGIVTLYVLPAPSKNYTGYELLQTLLALGFRYGDMKIFEWRKNPDGSGEILFNLAQALNPGTFDLSDVGSINCAGLALFMECKNSSVLADNLNLMLSLAEQIAEELGGDIYDENRRPLKAADLDSWVANRLAI